MPEITLKDVLHWIADNSDDTSAMDKINKLSFVFSSKYSNFVDKQAKQEEPEHDFSSILGILIKD